MKRLDYAIVIAIIVCSLAPLLFLSRAGSEVRIVCRGETVYRGSLSKDARIVTPDGHNTVVISGGKAYMEKADCPDGLCVESGYASAMRPIVCLPNEVTVEITAKEAAEYDTLAH